MSATGPLSLKMVTVFTRDIGNGFCASTIRTDAFAKTEEAAARLAAARFYGRPEREIELIRENDHVFVAEQVRHDEPHARRSQRNWLAIVALALVGITIVVLIGRAFPS